MTSAADLKFGDVIEFKFAGHTLRAMVLATTGNEVRTDEGTAALGGSNGILVLGLTDGVRDELDDWHPLGGTASLRDSVDFKVLNR